MTPETVGTFQSVAHSSCVLAFIANSGSPNVLQSHPSPMAFMLCLSCTSWSHEAAHQEKLTLLFFHSSTSLSMISTHGNFEHDPLVVQPRASLWACHYFCQVYYCWPWFHSQQFFEIWDLLRTVSISPPWLGFQHNASDLGQPDSISEKFMKTASWAFVLTHLLAWA